MSGDDYSTYLTNDSNTADCSIDISATSTSDSSHAFNIIVKTNLAVNWDVSVSDADIYQVASPSGLEYQEIFEIPYYGDETPPIALLDKTDISISDLWYPADLGISGVIGDISGGNRKLYDLCSYGYNLISINNPESATGLIFTPNNLSDTDFSNVSIFDNLGSITEIDTAPEEGYDITAHEAKISQTHLRINLLNNPIDGVSSETFSLTISGETDTVNSRIGSLPQLDDEGYHTQDSGIMHLHNGTAYNNRFNGIGVCGITRNGYFIVTKDTKLYQPTFDSSGYITGYNPDSDKKQGCSGWKLDTSTNIMSRREDLANEIGIYTYNIEEEISNTLTVAGDNNSFIDSLTDIDNVTAGSIVCDWHWSEDTSDNCWPLDKQNMGYLGETITINGTDISVGYVQVLQPVENMLSCAGLIYPYLWSITDDIVTDELELIVGWNIISPSQDNVSISDLLKELNNGIPVDFKQNSVWTLTENWDLTETVENNFTNTPANSLLSSYLGYWVYIHDLSYNSEIDISYIDITSKIDIKIGWNIVSSKTNGQTIYDLLKEIYKYCNQDVSDVDITIQDNSIWYTNNGWNNDLSNQENLKSLSDTDYLNPNLAYWVYISNIEIIS